MQKKKNTLLYTLRKSSSMYEYLTGFRFCKQSLTVFVVWHSNFGCRKRSGSLNHTSSRGRSTRPIRLSDDDDRYIFLLPQRMHRKLKTFQCEMDSRLFGKTHLRLLNPAWWRRRIWSIRPISHERRNDLIMRFSVQEVQEKNKMHLICHTRRTHQDFSGQVEITPA